MSFPATDQLRTEHRAMQRLLERFEGELGDPQGEGLLALAKTFAEIQKHLASHFAKEEKIFYPALASMLGATDPEITQPGTYQGELKMSNNTPGKEMISVPVTMIVNPPSTWGKLQGTVSGLGYCDANPAPLADAAVVVTYGGTTVNLKTDANGYYSYWFDAAASPLNITVNAVDHEAGSASATIVGGQTTTQDFSLR